MTDEQIDFTSPPRPEWFWELAIAVNAAFKGLLGAEGQSGHICRYTVPISVNLDVRKGWIAIAEDICGALPTQLRSGDVVVIAEKVVAASLDRIGPRALLHDPDPKTVPAAELPALARRWEQLLNFHIDPLHLLLADEYGDSQATVGADDHNARSAELAALIKQRFDASVDVVISDTDTGLDTRAPLIGTVTIGATPIGATGGLNLYEAMRCAVAAEFTRGHDRGIPIVLCVPADRRRLRPRIGEFRGYNGALHSSKEPGLTYA